MKKVDWKTLKLTLKAGDLTAEKNIQLDPGERIVAAATTGKAKDQIIDLGLYENGNQISAPMDLDFWTRSNSGNFLDGFKPLETTGGNTCTGRISTANAPAADIDIEIVFGIIKEVATC